MDGTTVNHDILGLKYNLSLMDGTTINHDILGLMHQTYGTLNT